MIQRNPASAVPCSATAANPPNRPRLIVLRTSWPAPKPARTPPPTFNSHSGAKRHGLTAERIKHLTVAAWLDP